MDESASDIKANIIVLVTVSSSWLRWLKFPLSRVIFLHPLVCLPHASFPLVTFVTFHDLSRLLRSFFSFRNASPTTLHDCWVTRLSHLPSQLTSIVHVSTLFSYSSVTSPPRHCEYSASLPHSLLVRPCRPYIYQPFKCTCLGAVVASTGSVLFDYPMIVYCYLLWHYSSTIWRCYYT